MERVAFDGTLEEETFLCRQAKVTGFLGSKGDSLSFWRLLI